MVKIVYSIFDYQNPKRIARLINRLNSESDYFYVHFDTSIGREKFYAWKKVLEESCPKSNLQVVSEVRCAYGTFGLVDANLNAMRFYENVDYDFYIDLSGDSYPLKPQKVLKKKLVEKNSALIDYFEIPHSEWYQGGLHRLNNKYYCVPIKKYPYVRFFKIPRLRKGLPGGLKPYGGLGNRCLQKKHVQYLLKFIDDNPSVVSFFRRVWGPGEIFYQTILLNSPLKDSIINDSIMYVDFSEGKSNPKMLTSADLEVIKNSGKLFARKFSSSVDDKVLDLIDDMIEKYDGEN